MRKNRRRLLLAGVVFSFLCLLAGMLFCLGVFPVEPPDELALATPSPTLASTASPSLPLEVPLYEFAIVLDVDNHQLKNVMRFHYTNNTGDPLYELYFHLYPNAYKTQDVIGENNLTGYYPSGVFSPGSTSVHRVNVNGESAFFKLEHDGQLLNVPFTLALAPGRSVEVTVEYNVQVPHMNNRFGYGNIGYQLGNFCPVLAVYENSAWNVSGYLPLGDPFYSEVADYKVAFTRPSAYVLACTGTITDEKITPDGLTTSYIAASKVRSFAAVAAKGYQIAEREEDGVCVKSYALTQKNASRAADIAVKALRLYTERIGTYPYDTLVIAQTNLSGGVGMEYPGLVMIERSLYLNGRDLDLSMTIAHEIAHQWFYAVVGNDEINAPWLDESLVNYLGLLYFEQYEPALFDDIREYTIDASIGTQYRIDGALNDYPTETDYANAVYVRGGALFDALRQEMGDDAFFDSLKYYYRENAFQIVTKQELYAALEHVSGRSWSVWFEDRLKQAQSSVAA